MDGVLADAHAGFSTGMARKYPEVTPLNDELHFFPLAGYADEDHAAAWDVLSEPGFFADLPLMPDALAGWERLLSAGYTPRICSSPLDQNPTCTEDKKSWLAENLSPYFGSEVVDNAIITHDKAAEGGIALIDDKPRISGSERASWQHVVFGRPYNAAVANQPRLDGWLDERLPDMLAEASKRYTDLGNIAITAN
jgi:5'-nucleotidase